MAWRQRWQRLFTVIAAERWSRSPVPSDLSPPPGATFEQQRARVEAAVTRITVAGKR